MVAAMIWAGAAPIFFGAIVGQMVRVSLPGR